LSIFVSKLNAKDYISFKKDKKIYKFKTIEKDNINYISLKKFLEPLNVEVSYNRLTHKISFNYNNKVYIFSFVTDSVFLDKKVRFFKKPIIFKKNNTYINVDILKLIASNLSYKYLSNVIVIDPGHGGNEEKTDLGCTVDYKGKKIYEKNIVLDFAKVLGKKLKRKGYKVIYTRTEDKKVSFNDRISKANSSDAMAFISLHVNESKNSSANGFEIFYPSSEKDLEDYEKDIAKLENKAFKEVKQEDIKSIIGSLLYKEHIKKSKKLATFIDQAFPKEFKKRCIKRAPFFILKRTTVPSVLLELGFISNEKDFKNLLSYKYKDDMASVIATGVDLYIKN
jgi:N-acetylmuramoyl-L-alanine amidase